MLTSAGEEDLERLTIFASSLRRFTPNARLVFFIDDGSVRALAAAEAAHAHIVTVKRPKESEGAAALHRCGGEQRARRCQTAAFEWRLSGGWAAAGAAPQGCKAVWTPLSNPAG